MEFDKSKVYTALNADESLIGAKGYFSESLCGLIRLVKSGYPPEHKVQCVDYDCIIADNCDVQFNFFYLVESAPVKPKYRPFKDCDELIKCYIDNCYKKQMSPNPNNFINEWIELPTIWVKSKSDGRKDLITSFNTEKKYICVDSYDCTFDKLLNNYTFLDGSVCGVEEL